MVDMPLNPTKPNETYIFTHTHPRRSESSKPIYSHTRTRVIQKVLSLTQKEYPLLNIFLWQHTPTSYKTRKPNSDFCLNFCAGEAHKRF